MKAERLWRQNPIILVLWGLLLVTALAAFVLGQWPVGTMALATLALAIAPAVLASRLHITLPVPFLFATTLFIIATVFMGEAFDFYERIWWWDIAVHGASAVGFGLIGFLFVFMLFEGDRYAAPPGAVAFIAFCLAMTAGVLWEVFEYLMDLSFGLSMQKSGLDDTMTDLMIDGVGATTGALAGYVYLKGRDTGLLTRLIEQFVSKNKHFYEKSRERLRKGSKR